MKGWDNMYGFGGVCVTVGVLYFIYSILCRDQVTFYNRIKGLKLIAPREFLRLQLIFSIVNAAYLILYGTIIILFRLDSVWIILGAVPFHFINLLLVIKSKEKGYIDYKTSKIYK